MEEEALQSIETLPVGLKSLREIKCYWDTVWSGAIPKIVFAMLKLPSIRKIGVQLGGDIDDTDNFNIDALDAASFGISSVTHLTLTSCIKPRALTRTLQLPRALTHLSCYFTDFNLCSRCALSGTRCSTWYTRILTVICYGALEFLSGPSRRFDLFTMRVQVIERDSISGGSGGLNERPD